MKDEFVETVVVVVVARVERLLDETVELLVIARQRHPAVTDDVAHAQTTTRLDDEHVSDQVLAFCVKQYMVRTHIEKRCT